MEVPFEAWGRSIARRIGEADQHVTAVTGLSLHPRDEPTQPVSVMYEPLIYMIAQEATHVLLGDERYTCGLEHFSSKDDEALENFARYVIRPSFTRGVEAET